MCSEKQIGLDKIKSCLWMLLRLWDFIFRFWNAGNRQTKTWDVSLKSKEWLSKWRQKLKATQWRNLTVTGRNEMAEQLEECEGLGAAAGGGEPGAAGGKGGGEREAVYFLYCLDVPFFN